MRKLKEQEAAKPMEFFPQPDAKLLIVGQLAYIWMQSLTVPNDGRSGISNTTTFVSATARLRSFVEMRSKQLRAV